MTELTDRRPNPFHNGSSNRMGMRTRFIAVLLLASLLCWSCPIAVGSSSSVQPVAQGQSRHSAGMQDHSCCPGAHGKVALALVSPLAPSTPCNSEHPCCAKSGPDSPSSLPASARQSLPNSGKVPVAVADRGREKQIAILAESSGGDPFRFHSARNTVLRI